MQQVRPGGANMRDAIPMDAALVHAPLTVDTAAVVTIPADAARGNIITQIWASYAAAPTAGSLKVENGATVVWGPHHITAAGLVSINFQPPLIGSKNTALVVTLSAGGAILGALGVNAYKLE